MKSIFFILSLYVLVSCNTKKEEVLDINDVIPTSKDYKEGQNNDDQGTQTAMVVYTGLNKENLNQSKIELSELTTTDTLLFPDRFTPISFVKFNYASSNEQLLYSNYRFKDSLKIQNVFLNWMNCYGLKCKSIELGEQINVQKEPFLMMVNDTSLIYISNCNSQEATKWLNYYTTDKKVQWKYILSQSKSGKLKWQKFKEENFEIIQPRIPVTY